MNKIGKEVSMMNKIVIVVVVIAVAIAGFFAGMKFQQSKAVSGAEGNFRTGMMGGNGTFRQKMNGGAPNGQTMMGQAVRGEIIKADDSSITVKLADGSTKIVVLSTNTTIAKSENGTKSDLKAGEQVMVFGSNNSDGSVTAQNVQLNPKSFFRVSSPSGEPKQ
jgi:hypothetical protein